MKKNQLFFKIQSPQSHDIYFKHENLCENKSIQFFFLFIVNFFSNRIFYYF